MLRHGGKPRREQRRWRLEGHIRCLCEPAGQAAPCLQTSDRTHLARWARVIRLTRRRTHASCWEVTTSHPSDNSQR